MLLCGFIVVIAVAFSVYGGFSNLVKIVDIGGTLKALRISNITEAPPEIPSTISTEFDEDTAGDSDSLDDEKFVPIWWSSNYNPFRCSNRRCFTTLFENAAYNSLLQF